MGDERIEFYDPIYQEGIVFEQGLPSERCLAQELSLDPREIIRTTEFIRLAYLQLEGIHRFSFPSSSNVCYAHAIGCWRLGSIAESLIRINIGEKRQSLRDWLIDYQLREAYYLSLLLHHIGQSPFGGIVGSHQMILEILVNAGIDSNCCEHQSLALICGKGLIFDRWKECRDSLPYDSGMTITDLISKASNHSSGSFSLSAVCYLISGDLSYIDDLSMSQQNNLYIVRNIIDGLINLRLIDRYTRNAYYSGLFREPLNYRCILNNIHIKQLTLESAPCFFINQDGASGLTNFIFSVRQINSTFFRNPQTVALKTMIDHALTLYLQTITSMEDRRMCVARIIMMDDNSLIRLLLKEGNLACKAIVKRVLSMNPYTYVGRWQTAGNFVYRQSFKNRIMKKYSAIKDNLPHIICWADPESADQSVSGEQGYWLDASKLYIHNNGQLSVSDINAHNVDEAALKLNCHPDYQNDFQLLDKTTPVPALWVFSSEGKDLKNLRQEINELLGHACYFEQI